MFRDDFNNLTEKVTESMCLEIFPVATEFILVGVASMQTCSMHSLSV